MESPIFIFSLPRSGSTLLQRILMSHPEIKSVSEPWVLLPLIYLNKKEGTLTEYSHIGAYRAISDFISNLPQKEKDYNLELKEFVSNLYSKQCSNNERYFLDKTPRYYLIIDEIVKIFPDAKFIFLFRNPIQIMSSIINTFSKGSFKNIHGYRIDLEKGMKKLSEGYVQIKNKSIALKYEDLVNYPDNSVKDLCSYLNLDYHESMIKKFQQETIIGKFGDKVGVKNYSKIESYTLNKWKSTLDNKIRINYALNYLDCIDKEILAVQGYNKSKLILDLKSVKPKMFKGIFDLFYIIRGWLIVRCKLNLILGKTSNNVKKTNLT